MVHIWGTASGEGVWSTYGVLHIEYKIVCTVEIDHTAQLWVGLAAVWRVVPSQSVLYGESVLVLTDQTSCM